MKKIAMALLSLTALVCTGVAVGKMTAYDASADEPQTHVVFSKTAYKVSTDGQKMLLVTAINNYSLVYEVGYEIEGYTIAEGDVAETKKYYDTITTGGTTEGAGEIFGTEYADYKLVVWEVKYTADASFNVYALEGEMDGETLVIPETEKKYTGTKRTNTTYTVTFANYDGRELQKETYYNGQMPEYTGETPTKESTAQYTYTFNGWDTEIKTVAGNATYTATYTETTRTYTVTFDTNGGSAIEAQTVEYGTPATQLSAFVPTKTGYTFGGWTLEDESPIPDGATVQGNITVKAKWTANTNTAYTVKHYQQNVADDNYTEVTEDVDNLTGTTGTQTTATAKTYTGFTAKTIEQQTIAGDGTTVVSVYYDRNLIAVSFDTQGGSTMDSVQVKYGATVSEVTDPTKETYNFIEWQKNGVKYDFTTPVTESVNLTAVWYTESLSTKDDLLYFYDHISSFKSAKLAKDIDLGDTVIGSPTASNTTLATFNGVFDGQNHSIKGGIYEVGGLFRNLGENGEIRNVAFTGALLHSRHAQGDNCCWSIVANDISGTIDNVLIDTEVYQYMFYNSALGWDVGGNYGSALGNKVNATAKISNVVLYFNLTNRYSSNGNLKDTSVGSASLYTLTGRLATVATGATFENVYVFNSTNASGARDSATNNDAGLGIHVFDLGTSCKDAGLDTAEGFNDSWFFGMTKAMMNAKTMEISKKAEFLEFIEHVDEYVSVKLTADIDLGTMQFGSKGYTATETAKYQKASKTFDGIFDGQGYSIIGGEFGVNGLFQNIGANGVVKNVAFTGGTLNGYDGNYPTAIIANQVSGTIKDVLIDVTIVARLNSQEKGGNFGSAVCSSITDTAKLENIVVYWFVAPRIKYNGGLSDIHYTASKAITGQGSASTSASIVNVYSFSLNCASGDQAGVDAINGKFQVLNYETTCAEAGLDTAEGFGEIWDFSGNKATMSPQE